MSTVWVDTEMGALCFALLGTQDLGGTVLGHWGKQETSGCVAHPVGEGWEKALETQVFTEIADAEILKFSLSLELADNSDTRKLTVSSTRITGAGQVLKAVHHH